MLGLRICNNGIKYDINNLHLMILIMVIYYWNLTSDHFQYEKQILTII